jgi:hypothetical protein
MRVRLTERRIVLALGVVVPLVLIPVMRLLGSDGTVRGVLGKMALVGRFRCHVSRWRVRLVRRRNRGEGVATSWTYPVGWG